MIPIRIYCLVVVLLIVGWSCDLSLGSPLARLGQRKSADLQQSASQVLRVGGASYWPYYGYGGWNGGWNSGWNNGGWYSSWNDPWAWGPSSYYPWSTGYYASPWW
ncbi:hypothetical protein HDE_13239 [Halotydeus destructor]|nr:hypothetical protein HDE_13239 [Halotydeus destructor]